MRLSEDELALLLNKPGYRIVGTGMPLAGPRIPSEAPTSRESHEPPAYPGGAESGPERPIVHVVIPCLRTYSETNVHAHWRQRQQRAKDQRCRVRQALTAATHGRPLVLSPQITVILTRISPRRLDSDNLQGSLKFCRDAVAAYLALDDGSPRLTWYYRQRKGHEPHTYAVEVSIAP